MNMDLKDQHSKHQNLVPADLMADHVGNEPPNNDLSSSENTFCGSATNLFKTPLSASHTECESIRLRQVEAIKVCFQSRFLKNSLESIDDACAALESDPNFFSSILQAAANSLAIHGYPLYPSAANKSKLTASLPVRGRYRHKPYDILTRLRASTHNSDVNMLSLKSANSTDSASAGVVYPSIKDKMPVYSSNVSLSPLLKLQSSLSPSEESFSTTELSKSSVTSAAITTTNDIKRPPSPLSPLPETDLLSEFEPKLFRSSMTEA